jgi:UDP-glucose 4-epimerase
MSGTVMKRALILGGAGFVGSRIARKLAERDFGIVVIDGLLERTGGRRENLAGLEGTATCVFKRVEDVDDLEEVVAGCDIIVDAMAWTSHRLAMVEPRRDLELNASSHLSLINCLGHLGRGSVIFLGSRSQYGSPKARVIDGDTPMTPVDVQGIHKVAAESYFRVYSQLKGFGAVSLRFANCYGPNQPSQGSDIGLIGGLIRSLIAGECVEVFGEGRKRCFVYVDDIAEIVARIAESEFTGFRSVNVRGREITIEELAKRLIAIAGTGSYVKKAIPAEIAAMDVGESVLDDSSLRELIRSIPEIDLQESLEATVGYFKGELHDMAL